MWLGDLAQDAGLLKTLMALGLHWACVPLVLVLASALTESVNVKGLGVALKAMGVYAVSHFALAAALSILAMFIPFLGVILGTFLASFGLSWLLVRATGTIVNGVEITSWRAAGFVTLLLFAATWLATSLLLG